MDLRNRARLCFGDGSWPTTKTGTLGGGVGVLLFNPDLLNGDCVTVSPVRGLQLNPRLGLWSMSSPPGVRSERQARPAAAV